jgi:hypothetical protein
MKNTRLSCKLALLATFCCASLPSLHAQNAGANSAVANTPYAIGAQRNGVAKCIPRINQVTSFLTANTSNSGMVFNPPGSDVNQKLVATVIEAQAQTGGPSFISASYAPTSNAQDCSATYDAVTFWPQACPQVATANFGAFKPAQALSRSILTLDGGPLVKVFLMPAGTGCVSIKKEVLY